MTDEAIPVTGAPLVTFALFAYNQERYVREAVEGAFAQTYQPLEIILSDDCSSDGTFAIMQEMAAGYRGPHKVIARRNETNRGLAEHVSSVIETITSDIIVVAAGDDISLPARTQRTVDLFAAHPEANAASFASIPIDEDGRELGAIRHRTKAGQLAEYSLADLFAGGMVGLGASRAYRKSMIETFGRLRPDCPTEDTPFLLRSLCLGTVLHSNAAMIRYRQHGANLSGRNNLAKMQSDWPKIARQYRTDADRGLEQGIIAPGIRDAIDNWIDRSAGLRQLRYDMIALPPSLRLAGRAIRSRAFSNRELAGYVKLYAKALVGRNASKRSRPVIGIVGENASSNVGDQLIYAVLSSLVRNHAEPLPIPLTRGEPWLRRLGMKSRSATVQKALARIARIESAAFRSQREDVRLSRQIRQCDAILIGGGELIRRNDVGFIENIDRVARICSSTNKKFAFFGVGVSANLAARDSATVRSALMQSAGIWVRDEQSKQRCSLMLADERRVDSTPDVVFHSATANLCRPSAARNGAAINVMSFATFSAALRRRGIEIDENRYLCFYAEVVDELLRQDIPVRLFTTGSGGDLPTVRRIADACQGLTTLRDEIVAAASIDSLLRVLSEAEYVLAARMHAGIAAAMVGARVLALDWDDKVLTCWAMVKNSHLVVDPNFIVFPNSGEAIAKQLLSTSSLPTLKSDWLIIRELDKCLSILSS